MEKVKQELAALGYNKTQIGIMIAAIHGVVIAPSLYTAANDASVLIRDTTNDLANANTVLKQIGGIVSVGPAKAKAPAKKKVEVTKTPTPPDLSPNQLDIQGKKVADDKADDYQAPAAKKNKPSKAPVIAKIEETPEPEATSKERKLEIEL